MKRLLISSLLLLTVVSTTSQVITISPENIPRARATHTMAILPDTTENSSDCWTRYFVPTGILVRLEGLPANMLKLPAEKYKIQCLPAVEVVAFRDTTSTWRICGSFRYEVSDSAAKNSFLLSNKRSILPNDFFKVYPNPSQRGETINVILQVGGQITLYDFSGRILMAQPGNSGLNLVIVPISYSTGTYLLRQGTKTARLVIQ